MTATLKLAKIVWGDRFLTYGKNSALYPGVDGTIVYEINIPSRGEIVTLYQPFKKGEHCKVNGRNVWGWDGNQEAPTLSPSIMSECPPLYRVHLFFRRGKIELLSDSTVQLVI